MTEIYSLVFTFTGKKKAGHAYSAVRNLIHLHPCDLSGYRMVDPDTGAWYVAVVGDKPAPTVHEPLVKALKHFGGKQSSLPAAILAMLYQRHFEQTTAKGLTWNEQHFDIDD